MTRYIAKPNTWYKEGTEVELVSDFGNGSGLFRGVRVSTGHVSDMERPPGAEFLDEEVCSFDEFRVEDVA